MFEELKCESLQGMVMLNQQISCGQSSCLLPASLEKCKYDIQVIDGFLRLNHSALNPDGFSWSSPPANGQQEYYELKSGDSCIIELIVEESFGYLDRIEVVNASLTKSAEFVYNVEF